MYKVVPKEKYGVKCRCSNGNDIWFEPLTDEIDGWVERTPEGAIVRVSTDTKVIEIDSDDNQG